MNINWVYFSDSYTFPEGVSTFLEKQEYTLIFVNQIEKLRQALESQITVLFINVQSQYDVYELSQEISVLYPQVYIILMVPEEMENLKKAMQVGASDTLRTNYRIEDLAETVAHAKKFMQHRAKMEPSVASLRKDIGRVIAVSGPKGGIGRTVLTVNLAVAYARMGKKVAVIDGNLQFGEISIFYNVKPKRTIYEWVKEGYGQDHYSLRQYMTVVDGDISVLAAPTRPEFFEGITELHMKAAIEEARELFDIILIDLPAYLSDIHLRSLNMADEILLMTGNDLSVLRLTKLYLETLEAIQLKDKVKLVLNRYVKGQGLELNRIEEILESKVYQTLPEQVNVAVSSIKAGQPFMLSNSRSHLGKAVWQMAENSNFQKTVEVSGKKKEKKWYQLGK
ncbi:AAA family ATPase [Neobacillus rhizophilus]|uniref:AAA family ATPase n=1 Tax=Neobacillus rhizophilus TaxID=2833579 RepID=A0A942U6F1_9BACI|nr:AAA family ATPase [Neobacillus rhizophilus]MBS4213281.1 AAA family ATPase [Neobacillus rhizophilus]